MARDERPSVAIRPPAYPSRAELAWELCCAESTIDTLVQRGVIPPPKRMSNGMIRWRWESVDMALASLGEESKDSPEQQGVQRAIQAAKERGRGRAA